MFPGRICRLWHLIISRTKNILSGVRDWICPSIDPLYQPTSYKFGNSDFTFYVCISDYYGGNCEMRGGMEELENDLKDLTRAVEAAVDSTLGGCELSRGNGR